MTTLFPLPPRCIAAQAEITGAWTWLKSAINDRPSTSSGHAIYDRKLWAGAHGSMQCLQPTMPYVGYFATLYIVSQFGSLDRVFDLTNHNIAADLVIYTDTVEDRLRTVIDSTTRFKHALSEHLAFWVFLAVEHKQGRSIKYARSIPNRKPEQQGPDGISIAARSADCSNAIVEVHSVKSSGNDPRQLISTRSLRIGKDAVDFDKLLDGFWLTSHKGDSIIQLSDLLANVCGQLNLSSSEEIRMALLFKCVYNATVVASDMFAAPDLFDGYEHVVAESERRVATYIGSSDWSTFAGQVRSAVKSRLQSAGAW